MNTHATSSPAGPRPQSPFFTIPFHLPRTGSSDNLGSSPAPPMPHSPLLDMIHRVEHFGESHPEWGPFRHHHHHESPTLIGGCGDLMRTSTPPNFHVIAPSPSAAAAFPRSLTPFTLPHLALPPPASSSTSPSLSPRPSSSTSLDNLPFTLSTKHGDGLITPIRSPPLPSSPTHSHHELIHQQAGGGGGGGGAPVVYESVAAAAASASHLAPPICAHCGSSVTSGRPHHHPHVPSPLHSTASHAATSDHATEASGAGKKPRPLMQAMVDTCKNCVDRVSETAARGVHREMGTPGRTPYVNFRQ